MSLVQKSSQPEKQRNRGGKSEIPYCRFRFNFGIVSVNNKNCLWYVRETTSTMYSKEVSKLEVS